MLDEEVDEEVEGAVEAGAVDVDPPDVDPPEVELVEEDDESLLAARESVL